MSTAGRSWRWAISQSLGSWAGVTLTAPVPNSRSTAASATIGISRSTSGRRTRPADQVAVAGVVGVDGHGGVAQHRLGPRGRDPDEARPVGQRVAQVGELARDLLVLDLDVGQGGQAAGAPVDDPLGPGRAAPARRGRRTPRGRPGQALVHGEALAATSRPSRRGAASGRGCGRRTRPSRPRPAPRTPRGPGRGGSCPPWRAPARPRSGWRCRRGPCRAATAPRTPACGASGRGSPGRCGRGRGRCAATRSHSAAGRAMLKRGRSEAGSAWNTPAVEPALVGGTLDRRGVVGLGKLGAPLWGGHG